MGRLARVHGGRYGILHFAPHDAAAGRASAHPNLGYPDAADNASETDDGGKLIADNTKNWGKVIRTANIKRE